MNQSSNAQHLALVSDFRAKILKNTKFRKVSQELWKLIAASSAQNQLQSDQWCINLYQYVDSKWKKLFKQMQQTKIKCLSVYESQQNSILKDISHIKLTNLRQLNLQNDKIDNIECLQLLESPKLRHLCLGKNRINRLKSLGKTYFYALKSLHLQGNLINLQPEDVSRLFLNKLQLSCQKTMFFLHFQQENQQRPCQNTAVFVKTQAKVLLTLDFQKKISQSRTMQIIRKKNDEQKMKDRLQITGQ